MKGGCRVAWLHRSPVFHHARYHFSPEGHTLALCGVTLHCPRYRAQEGTERQATALGLRRCRRCSWPTSGAL